MRADLEQQLRFAPNLPTLPGVALRVVELGKNPETGLAEMADTIARDPALTIRMLQVANSPLYGLRRQVSNLRQALGLLGLNTAMTLTLSFSLRHTFGKSQCCTKIDFYWRRSLLAAQAAQECAIQLKLPCQEESFLTALLQDLGILALERLRTEEYHSLLSHADSDENLATAEKALYDTDHTEIGAWLLADWDFPEHLQKAVASHLNPASVSVSPHYSRLPECVALSGRIADLLLDPDGQDRFKDTALKAKQWLGLTEAELYQVLERLGTAVPEIEHLFEVKLAEPSIIAGLLDQAKNLLVLRNLQLAQEAHQATQRAEILEARTIALEEQSRRDGLTGLYSRAHLDRVLNDEFEQARRHNWPLTIAFIDLDHFKKINDTHGHQAGDRVLIGIAKLLNEQMRQTDVVARYGGEEFMILLPGLDESTAKQVLQRLLGALRARKHDLDGHPVSLQVTASIGMVTYDPPGSAFSTVETLVRAADQAVYKAKHNGRNRLVVYSR